MYISQGKIRRSSCQKFATCLDSSSPKTFLHFERFNCCKQAKRHCYRKIKCHFCKHSDRYQRRKAKCRARKLKCLQTKLVSCAKCPSLKGKLQMVPAKVQKTAVHVVVEKSDGGTCFMDYSFPEIRLQPLETTRKFNVDQTFGRRLAAV